MNRLAILLVLLAPCLGRTAPRYPATGMVLALDSVHKRVRISCNGIPGFMGAMAMPFVVRDEKELSGLVPGTTVEFTLVLDGALSYAEHIHARGYESIEQDPLTARRLKLLNKILHPASSAQALKVGDTVPNFVLIDQVRRRVSLSQFAGKIVALNFIYTSCALPTYCFRISNHFGVLTRRFKRDLGRNLILLTVTFDPMRDQPETLARYATTWKADPKTWHFLTGPVADVQRLTAMFGVDSFPDEGLMDHSLHTVIIDRRGKIAANVEGNAFSAEQLADLVQSSLDADESN